MQPLKVRDQNIPKNVKEDNISTVFDELMDEVESISSDDEPKVEDIFEKVNLSNKKFLNLDKRVNADKKKKTIDFAVKQKNKKRKFDEDNKENIRNQDNFLCKRANPETDYGVIRIPNPYKSSYTMEYDRWRTTNEERRKALV